MHKIKNDWKCLALLVCAAGAVGILSWSGSVVGLLSAPCLIALWRLARHRLAAFVTVLTYYLTAGRGLFHGAGVFFGPPPALLPSWCYGLFIWIVPSILLAMVWALTWGKTYRGVRLMLALLVVSIPPFGIFGWANPLTSAGAYFPGLGWVGLALTIAGLIAITEARRPLLTAIPFLAVALFANARYDEPNLPSWVAVDTHFGQARTTDDEFDRLQALQNLVVVRSAAAEVKVIVLPELVGGDWSINESWWEQTGKMLSSRGQTVLIGAHQPVDDGKRYVNALFSVGHDGGRTLVDRVPVPISMWQPFTGEGAKTFWGDSGIEMIAGKKVASLICYEQLLIWPVLVSMAHRPEVIVGSANDWWARETSIPGIQREAVTAWSRLFGVASIWAHNE